MNKRFIPLLILLLLVGCNITKNIPTQEKIIINYKDSIAWHDSTIYHHIYKEHYKDLVDWKDTLKLETSYSQFKAWNDSTVKSLKGEAVNKIDSIPYKIKWKEKIVYRDSIQIVKEPYPVEVIKEVKYTPKFLWFTLGWFIASILYIGIKLYLKIKK